MSREGFSKFLQVAQLLAEAVTMVLTWEDNWHLSPSSLSADFCDQISPPRARSGHASASGALSARSNRSQGSPQVESECFEHPVLIQFIQNSVKFDFSIRAYYFSYSRIGSYR